MAEDSIVAVALLTQSQVDRYVPALKKVFPVHETPCFTELLRLIDQADCENWREEDRLEALKRLRAEGSDSTSPLSTDACGDQD